jgi:hypothetical protein
LYDAVVTMDIITLVRSAVRVRMVARVDADFRLLAEPAHLARLVLLVLNWASRGRAQR